MENEDGTEKMVSIPGREGEICLGLWYSAVHAVTGGGRANGREMP